MPKPSSSINHVSKRIFLKYSSLNPRKSQQNRTNPRQNFKLSFFLTILLSLIIPISQLSLTVAIGFKNPFSKHDLVIREENFNKETFSLPFLTQSYHSQTSLKFIDAVSKLFHFLNNVFHFFCCLFLFFLTI